MDACADLLGGFRSPVRRMTASKAPTAAAFHSRLWALPPHRSPLALPLLLLTSVCLPRVQPLVRMCAFWLDVLIISGLPNTALIQCSPSPDHTVAPPRPRAHSDSPTPLRLHLHHGPRTSSMSVPLPLSSPLISISLHELAVTLCRSSYIWLLPFPPFS